jgi:hypothetical protein
MNYIVYKSFSLLSFIFGESKGKIMLRVSTINHFVGEHKGRMNGLGKNIVIDLNNTSCTFQQPCVIHENFEGCGGFSDPGYAYKGVY